MSSRLKLLRHLRSFVTTEASSYIYSYDPIMFTYCNILKLSFNATQLNQINAFQHRAEYIIKGRQCDIEFHLDLINSSKRKACSFVHDVISGNVCELFHDYYELRTSNTRNNGHMIKLPKVKLEYGRSSVKYMGAKLFNDLPLDLRKKITDGNFKKLLRGHFRA